MPRVHPLALALAAAALVAGCSRREEVRPALREGDACPTFANPVALGEVREASLDELSGLALSRRQAGVLWTHNDSGARPELYALSPAGELLAVVEVDGAAAVDWEDLAIGPGPEAGRDYLYIGDLGDNRRRRHEVTVYRIPEPTLTGAGEGPLRLRSAPAEAIVLHYPGGPENAEALLVDPIDGGIYVVTKRVGEAALHRAREGSLERIAAIDAGRQALVTAGEISADGRWIALRTYNHAYLWRRAPGEAIADALARAPCPVHAPREPQGEAIAFDPAGGRLLSVSERAEAEDRVIVYEMAFQTGP
ncbi:MAG: hypothetical protein H6711_31775 [Myxococcales bacterium]|nr:hypothetical protein [Myxococcales bacterium]